VGRVLAVNLRAVFLLTRLVLADMTQAGRGTIVNVSSVLRPREITEAAARLAEG
jgi:NAD(P)-dependent dehydrogenase (short-subunit alcohol dehydrogenase family)